MRPASACIACRQVHIFDFQNQPTDVERSERRKRCTRPRPGARCFFCTKRGLTCTPETSATLNGNADTGGLCYALLHECRLGKAFRLTPTINIGIDLATELVNLYFQYIHVAFHSIFHQPSIEQGVRSGSLPQILLLGIASLSSRFSSHASLTAVPPRERGTAYRKAAERLVNFHSTSLVTVQTCVLIASALSVEGEASTESVYLNVACRLATIMNLPRTPAVTCVEQEVQVRVWWSLVATDTWSSAALQIPRALPIQQQVPMPMDEESFYSLDLDEVLSESAIMPHQGSAPGHSIFAQMIGLNQILDRVLTFNRKVSFGWPENDVLAETGVLHELLDQWHAQLPDGMIYSPEMHERWARKGHGPKFTILHINYNYARQLLYFRFLYICHGNDDIAATDSRRSYAERCKAHGAHCCELIQRANNIPGSSVMYPLIGHITVVASTIQLYTLLFDPDELAISGAKTRLEHNFGLLDQLQHYWPNLDACMDKFRSFHQSCLKDQPDVFRMDRWLHTFMVDYARSVVLETDSERKP